MASIEFANGKQKKFEQEKTEITETQARSAEMDGSVPSVCSCSNFFQKRDRRVVASNRVEVKEQAHGWRGNTTDKWRGAAKLKAQFFIRGFALPSVGLSLMFHSARQVSDLDRTTLAWIRTTLALAGFGFGMVGKEKE